MLIIPPFHSWSKSLLLHIGRHRWSFVVAVWSRSRIHASIIASNSTVTTTWWIIVSILAIRGTSGTYPLSFAISVVLDCLIRLGVVTIISSVTTDNLLRFILWGLIVWLRGAYINVLLLYRVIVWFSWLLVSLGLIQTNEICLNLSNFIRMDSLPLLWLDLLGGINFLFRSLWRCIDLQSGILGPLIQLLLPDCCPILFVLKYTKC